MSSNALLLSWLLLLISMFWMQMVIVKLHLSALRICVLALMLSMADGIAKLSMNRNALPWQSLHVQMERHANPALLMKIVTGLEQPIPVPMDINVLLRLLNPLPALKVKCVLLVVREKKVVLARKLKYALVQMERNANFLLLFQLLLALRIKFVFNAQMMIKIPTVSAMWDKIAFAQIS